MTPKTTRQTAASGHNLPAEVASFIGREHEMAEIKRLLLGTRLITLTGAGGSGKTRLALLRHATTTPRTRCTASHSTPSYVCCSVTWLPASDGGEL
jgi:hypothetical protein